MLNPAVSQATISTTICLSDYTGTIRPPASLTNTLKAHQLSAYGFTDQNVSDYEEDHVIALELGGAPRSPSNLWPEPHAWSRSDDRLENDLHVQVCAGHLDLASAQLKLLAAKVARGYRTEASVA